jgi:hypothetical protein
MKKIVLFCLTFLAQSWLFSASAGVPPSGLTVNFLSHPGQVFLNGYPAVISLDAAVHRRESFQFATIGQTQPFFGWVVNSGENSVRQAAYRILVASAAENIRNGSGDMWDSGKTENRQSLNVVYGGKPLEAGKVYFWKVKTWDGKGEESPFSEAGSFVMADKLEEYHTARYPLQKHDEFPVEVRQLRSGGHFVDFGKAAFGRLRLVLHAEQSGDSVHIHLGEAVKDGRIDRKPGGTIRYSHYSLVLKKGWHTYTVLIAPDKRNTGPQAVLMPVYTGEVTPFRYCEIENYAGKILREMAIRETVFYPFDDEESGFASSDTVLNRVWDLCKYSIKATSFAGIYVDGDRERIPYEADALINQLGHYGVAREYSLARHTLEYLIFKPTWPTEWILQTVLMAWEDYMYTGNSDLLKNYYTDLKAKALLPLADDMGFISTRTGKVTPEVLQSIHFNGTLKDIVDWPQKGILGLGKNEEGETDGFVFQDINTVVNAYHYRALVLMGRIAEVTGHREDVLMFEERAVRLKKAFNEKLLDRKRGIYVDGWGTDHASLHANMFPLAFGLVPDRYVKTVTAFIRTRGMACSVYGSQFLMDAIYDGNDGDYGLQLLASTAERSWYNMIRVGSTITLEAWDNKYKPNQDWNHAWGAVPANLIPRKLMGIEPLEPGFSRIRIKPQPSTLEWAEIKHPVPHGEVRMAFKNKPGVSFDMELAVPANSIAQVYLPLLNKKQKVLINGLAVPFTVQGNYAVIESVGSGKNKFEVRK